MSETMYPGSQRDAIKQKLADRVAETNINSQSRPVVARIFH
jgi:hypothetical protein